MAASAYLRGIADQLAGFAGGTVGAIIGTRRGKPVEGALLGRTIAPRLVESAALGIADVVKRKRKQSRGQKARSKKMSTAMKKANSKAKLKNGSWRKGWNQKRLMKEAHRLCK